MPRLFQINVNINRGSTGKIVEQIGLLASSKGWNVKCAYGWRISTPSHNDVERIGTDIDIKYHAAMTRLFDRQGLHSSRATRILIQHIIEFSPDIIHIHNIHGYYINYPLLFEFLSNYKKPVIWTLHDCWPITGHCAHFSSVGCDKWKNGCYACPLKKDYPKSVLFDRSSQNYQDKKKYFKQVSNLHLVAVSQWVADVYKQSFLKEASIHIIKNGIDLSIFHPYPQRETAKYRILSVSNRWIFSKGLADIFMLRDLLPYEHYEIILVGISERLKEKLPKGIVGITRTENQTELAKYYSSADVFVNPTYADSYPTVNLESLACGTPVITYNTGGSPEIVDEKTGIVVEQGNYKALAEAVINLRYHPLNREDCVNRAIGSFNKNKCFQSYISLYEEILNE